MFVNKYMQIVFKLIIEYIMVSDITILSLANYGCITFARNHGYRLDICETVISQPFILIFMHI